MQSTTGRRSKRTVQRHDAATSAPAALGRRAGVDQGAPRRSPIARRNINAAGLAERPAISTRTRPPRQSTRRSIEFYIWQGLALARTSSRSYPALPITTNGSTKASPEGHSGGRTAGESFGNNAAPRRPWRKPCNRRRSRWDRSSSVQPKATGADASGQSVNSAGLNGPGSSIWCSGHGSAQGVSSSRRRRARKISQL